MVRTIPIKGKPLQRYLAALATLDLNPPSLSSLRVDKSGWSPEVAAALGEEDYLIVGGALNAVLVSPEQRGLAVLRPAHTFDDLALTRLFADCGRQITNLTERGAVVATLAPNFSGARLARDLTHVQEATITAVDTAGVMDAARVQRSGAEKIRDTRTEAWADVALCRRLIESSATFGDLREQAIDINPIPFADVRCFGTRLLAGGAWVFRDLPRDKTLVVVRECEGRNGPTAHYLCLNRPGQGVEAVDRLWRGKILDVHHERFAGNPERVGYLRDAILAHAALAAGVPERLANLNKVKRARLARDIDGDMPPAYVALDRYAALLAEKLGVTRLDAFVRENDLAPLLAEPTAEASDGAKAAGQNLLAVVEPRDVVRLYRHAPTAFHNARADWPEAFRLWVDQQISLAGL